MQATLTVLRPPTVTPNVIYLWGKITNTDHATYEGRKMQAVVFPGNRPAELVDAAKSLNVNDSAFVLGALDNHPYNGEKQIVVNYLKPHSQHADNQSSVNITINDNVGIGPKKKGYPDYIVPGHYNQEQVNKIHWFISALNDTENYYDESPGGGRARLNKMKARGFDPSKDDCLAPDIF